MKSDNELKKEAMEELIKTQEEIYAKKENEIEALKIELFRLDILSECEFADTSKTSLTKLDENSKEIKTAINCATKELKEMDTKLKILKSVKESYKL